MLFRFLEPPPYHVDVLLAGRYTFPGLLLKGVEDIDEIGKLHRLVGTKRIGSVLVDDFDNLPSFEAL